MSNTIKNLIIVLGILALLLAGYFFLGQESSGVIRTAESNQQLEQMLIRTQQFEDHRNILNTITLDTTLLTANEFRTLRSYAPEPQEFPSGRSNPFTAVSVTNNNPIVTDLAPVTEPETDNSVPIDQ